MTDTVAGRARRIAATVLAFAGGQTALQALQFATGLVLVRSWPIELFAIWAIITATQATISLLSDLGARDGVIALSGEGRFPMERLIEQALILRFRHLCALIVPVAGYFIWLWGDGTVPTVELVCIIGLTFTTAFANSWTSYYTLSHLAARDMAGFYKPQVVAGGVRFTLVCGLVAAGADTLLLVVAATAATSLATGLYFRAKALRPSGAVADRDCRRAIQGYVYAIAPATIYFAFQDQLSIFLLSIFGGSADVSATAAIGRLAAIFQLLVAANASLVQPWIAGAGRNELAGRILFFVSGACIVAMIMTGLAWLRPEIPLLLLGQTYAHAQHELVLAIAAGSLFYVASTCHCIDVARGWFRRWTGVAYVVTVGSVQLSAIAFFGIRNAADAFWISIAISAALILFYGLHIVLGLAGVGSRSARPEPPPLQTAP